MATTAVRERPILFSALMVRALLSGAKTQTRRVVKPQPTCPAAISDYSIRDKAVCIWPADYVQDDGVRPDYFAMCPYGITGDRLWVREIHRYQTIDSAGFHVEYSDGETVSHSLHDRSIECDRLNEYRDGKKVWRPSIHMPRWACRIALEIIDVRVERIQDISESDATAEGALTIHTDDMQQAARVAASEGRKEIGPRDYFRQLWDSINCKRGYSWQTNPYVWAVTFKRIEATQ